MGAWGRRDGVGFAAVDWLWLRKHAVEAIHSRDRFIRKKKDFRCRESFLLDRCKTLILNDLQEFLNSQTRMLDQASERASCNLRMIRNRKRGDVSGLGHDDVASSLPSHCPPEPLECLDHYLRTKQRNWRHYTATSICLVATVKGIPCSARTSRHSLMAS